MKKKILLVMLLPLMLTVGCNKKTTQSDDAEKQSYASAGSKEAQVIQNELSQKIKATVNDNENYWQGIQSSSTSSLSGSLNVSGMESHNYSFTGAFSENTYISLDTNNLISSNKFEAGDISLYSSSNTEFELKEGAISYGISVDGELYYGVADIKMQETDTTSNESDYLFFGVTSTINENGNSSKEKAGVLYGDIMNNLYVALQSYSSNIDAEADYSSSVSIDVTTLKTYLSMFLDQCDFAKNENTYYISIPASLLKTVIEYYLFGTESSSEVSFTVSGGIYIGVTFSDNDILSQISFNLKDLAIGYEYVDGGINLTLNHETTIKEYTGEVITLTQNIIDDFGYENITTATSEE